MANTKVTGDVIANGTISTVHLADNAITSDKITGITTAHITEGSNLYYTDTRVRAAISVNGNALSYDSSTGVITSNYEESPTFTGNVNTGRLFVEQSGADMIDMTRTSVGTYRLAISTSDKFSIYDVGAASDRLLIDSSGNVGIGTSSPDVKLHIVGDGDRLEISSADYDLIKMGAYGDSGADLDNGFLNLLLDGSEKIRLLANGTSYFNGGNVGIGTTAPAATLDVDDDNTGKIRLLRNGSTRVELSNNANEGELSLYRSSTVKTIYISSYYNSYFNGGNVGIGTTAPSTRLHTFQATENWVFIETSGTNAVAGLRTQTSTGSRQNTLYRNVTSNLLTLRAGTDDGEIQFIAGGSSAEAMRIDSSQKVGIGTTNPQRALDVVATADSIPAIRITRNGDSSQWMEIKAGGADASFISRTAAAHSQFQFISDVGGSQTTRMIIDQSGNVGIGTTSPSQKLEVRDGDITTRDASNTNYAQLSRYTGLILKGNGSGSRGVKTPNTDALTLGTNNAERMRIDSSGDVSIKTGYLSLDSKANNSASVAGEYRLALGHDASTDASWIQSNGVSGTQRKLLLNPLGGNVGIGTTSPSRALDVNGEITHGGLVLKAGAFVDGLVTINKTVSISANTWTSLGISLSDIGGTGTFAVQVYSNAHGSTGGAWYNMYWSGIMSWYHSSVNDNDIDEIPLHMAGHARNNNTLELRTKLHTADGSSYANRCELQIKTANALSSAPISFRFRKLL